MDDTLFDYYILITYVWTAHFLSAKIFECSLSLTLSLLDYTYINSMFYFFVIFDLTKNTALIYFRKIGWAQIPHRNYNNSCSSIESIMYVMHISENIFVGETLDDNTKYRNFSTWWRKTPGRHIIWIVLVYFIVTTKSDFLIFD